MNEIQQRQACSVVKGEVSSLLRKFDSLVGECVKGISNCSSKKEFDYHFDRIEGHLLSRQKYGICGAECDMLWTHSDGVSAKEMTLSPMSVVTGSEHKVQTMNIVTSGSVIVITNGCVNLFSAGDVFTSNAGVRKLGITLEGVKFVNIFPNPDNIKEEEELDKMFFEDPINHQEASEYECFRNIIGIPQETIDSYMEEAGTPIPIPCGSMLVSNSEIDNKGVFATRNIKEGERFPVFIESERTILARYSNHSFSPNVYLVSGDGVALRDINSGEEITMNYLDNYIKTNGEEAMKCLAQ